MAPKRGSKKKKPARKKTRRKSRGRRPALSLDALSLAELAELLRSAGSEQLGDGQEAVDKLNAHLVAGAPQGAGGTIDLMHYAAWLVRQMAN